MRLNGLYLAQIHSKENHYHINIEMKLILKHRYWIIDNDISVQFIRDIDLHQDLLLMLFFLTISLMCRSAVPCKLLDTPEFFIAYSANKSYYIIFHINYFVVRPLRFSGNQAIFHFRNLISGKSCHRLTTCFTSLEV